MWNLVESKSSAQHGTEIKTNICYSGPTRITADIFYHCCRLYQSICCYIQLYLVKWYYKGKPVGVKLSHRSICRGNTASYLSTISSSSATHCTHSRMHRGATLQLYPGKDGCCLCWFACISAVSALPCARQSDCTPLHCKRATASVSVSACISLCERAGWINPSGKRGSVSSFPARRSPASLEPIQSIKHESLTQ